ncbi:MAG: TIGR01459 family HAD-type hydrolase [Alphaproteobacteria bacterium]|nr:TIGR01459 family HAD-type hydrolase [Alphaproteobacteria bacterium]
MTHVPIQTLDAIIDQYDAFIIDLWGVIHDGQALYPGVLDTLRQLQVSGKQALFLSNAPRRAHRAKELLDTLGVPVELYKHIVTSGEVAHHYVQHHPVFSQSPHYYIGPDRDRGMFDDLASSETHDPAEASFMLVTGYDHDDSLADEKNPQLKAALKHGLPLLCANPDLVIVRHSGKQALCAGVIAQSYESMGGQVEYFGKPFKQVYQRCFDILNVSPQKIAAIGDSLSHDIRGANNVGVDSYLVLQGIHGNELGFTHGRPVDKMLFEHVCKSHHGYPTGVLERF